MSVCAAESVPEFRRRLNAYAAERLTAADFQPQLADRRYGDLRELTTGPAVEELLSMAPFGFGNPAPMLAVLGAEVASAPVVMKEKHLRVHLRQDGRSLFPKAWNFAERAADFPVTSAIDAAFSVEEDFTAQTADSRTGLRCCAMSGPPPGRDLVGLGTPKTASSRGCRITRNPLPHGHGSYRSDCPHR